MSINIADELHAATTKGKIASAKEVFLTGDTENLQQIGEKTHQLEDSIKNIAATGGASTAAAVTFDNVASGMAAVNAQAAIEELHTKNKAQDAELNKKFNKEDISQEIGDSDYKTVSQKGIKEEFSKIENTVNFYVKQGYQYKGFATLDTIPPNLSNIKGGIFYFAKDSGTYTNFTNDQGVALKLNKNIVYLIRSYSRLNVPIGWVAEEIPNIASKQVLDIACSDIETLKSNIYQCHCHTAKDIAAKEIDIPNFKPSKNIRIIITFDEGSTADNTTLNINNTGEKLLYLYNTRVSSKNPIYKNDILDIYYNGNDYMAVKIDGEAQDIFGGIADTSTVPLMPTPKRNIYYIAFSKGTYTNFGGITLDGNCIYLFKALYSGASFKEWTTDVLLNLESDISYANFVGFADVSTSPVLPTLKNTYWYLAFNKGSYTNFKTKTSNIILDGNCVYRLRASFEGGIFAQWVAERLDIPTISSIETITKTWLENNQDNILTDGSVTKTKLDTELGEKLDNLVIGNTLGLTNSDNDYLSIGRFQQGAANNQCVAIGSHNMTNNTGIKNVTVGHDNMNATTGNKNTSVGYHSLYRNTSGSENSAFGTESQDDNTTGNYNVSVGAYSLQRNRLGDKNTAIGAYALKGIDGQDGQGTAIGRKNYGNTVLGADALRSAQHDCNNNIAIGVGAMKNSGTISDSIVIGNNIESTKNNQMIIGSNNITEVILCGDKKINFNNDGTVTWEKI